MSIRMTPRALKGNRAKAYFQIHFGADYATGTYGWTTNIDTIKRSVDWQLHALQTDYIDFGFIHCIDDPADLRKVEKADLDRILGFLEAESEETDYSVIGNFAPQDASGKCVYCNHCKPCPAGLDIGLINKYYDLSKAGDRLARNHYEKLEKKAFDCLKCGHCNHRCPFHVDQVSRMEVIASYFENKCT